MPLTGNFLDFSYQKDLVSLYIHVPFCTKKCPYCHFAVRKDKASEHKLWLDSTLLELARHQEQFCHKNLVSIYFGGGTPSLLDPADIETIREKIFSLTGKIDKNLEITLELNPESVTRQKLLSYRDLGINRLSIGVQSFDDTLLHHLGRTHTSQSSLEAIALASESGFQNISIDLMYDVPYQTLEMWQKTVMMATDQKISHISLYNLTFEPHTLFFKEEKKLKPQVPSEEISLQMLSYATEAFSQAGFYRYEISAFAKDNRFSIHNTGYWLSRDFLGIGPSAFSYVQGKRYRNILQMPSYAKSLFEGHLPIDFEEKLPYPQNLQEILAIQLRLMQGVSKEKIATQFGPFPSALEEQIEKLKRDGYLAEQEGKLFLTEQGILFYDDVATALV